MDDSFDMAKMTETDKKRQAKAMEEFEKVRVLECKKCGYPNSDKVTECQKCKRKDLKCGKEITKKELE